MAKIGDIVRFLNSTGGGRIASITGNIAHVVDEDGFETPVLLREIVVVGTAESQTPAKPTFYGPSSKEVKQPDTQARTDNKPTVAAPKIEEDIPVEETPEGEKLNVVLAFEPENLKELTTTTIDTYLVNDSNYYLFFTYMTRSDDDSKWVTRYAGTVAPNIQLYLGELSRERINEIGHVAFQYIAFKNDRKFDLKRPAFVDIKFDNTKFFKLHCYRSNPYFDKEVIALEIVKNDRPAVNEHVQDANRLEKELNNKIRADRTVRKRVVKHSEKRNNDIIEVDLHISELVDTTRGLSNADMLNLQVDEFRRVMDSNLKNHGQKIVFIHGKGEGVLRQALMKELNYRYKGHLVQDASFREYGYGATQVTIR